MSRLLRLPVPSPLGRSNILLAFHPRRRLYSQHSLKTLQAAFKDPSSPYHLPPGTQGPASPDEAPADLDSLELDSQAQAAKVGRNKLIELGYDPASFWEQRIVWGDMDSFQHVNNAQYVRFLESGRWKWLTSIADELGGPDRVRAMMKGQGVSFILKSLEVQFKRPVVFPDTLLVAHKPHLLNSRTDRPPLKPRSHFNLAAVAYSYSQGAIVLESDSVIVWYDYDALKKCDPGEAAREVIWKRIKEGP